MKIYIIRHGKTVWNEHRRTQGRIHNRLCKDGIISSIQTAEKLKIIKLATTDNTIIMYEYITMVNLSKNFIITTPFLIQFHYYLFRHYPLFLFLLLEHVHLLPILLNQSYFLLIF